MTASLEVLFTPAESAGLAARDLSGTDCVVFDILRATTTMATALANGARAMIPVAEISEALAFRERRPAVLLAGERDGLRIGAAQTGGIEFDLGNSPREFTSGKVRGRTVVMTTTNGTRSLRHCAGGRRVLIGSFLNLGSTVESLLMQPAGRLLLVCAGTQEQAAYEDTLAAGALCELIWEKLKGADIADSAWMARELYRGARGDLAGAVRMARNGRRLLGHPELREDVPFCLQTDVLNLAAGMDGDGAVRMM